MSGRSIDGLRPPDCAQLEQTGRVFAALANNPKSPPTAQITKLKHVLPGAARSFHEALDQFESELVRRHVGLICRC